MSPYSMNTELEEKIWDEKMEVVGGLQFPYLPVLAFYALMAIHFSSVHNTPCHLNQTEGDYGVDKVCILPE